MSVSKIISWMAFIFVIVSSFGVLVYVIISAIKKLVKPPRRAGHPGEGELRKSDQLNENAPCA